MTKTFCIFNFILMANLLFGQKNNVCDSIVANPDTVAIYKNGSKDILDFFSKNIKPLIDTCYFDESRMISNLKMQINIDRNGKIISAYVMQPDLPSSCKTKIQAEFLKMDNWTAARYKGKFVCSRVQFPFHINWK